MIPRHKASEFGGESWKYRHLTIAYLQGTGVDIGSGGWPVVPWAIQIEQDPVRFEAYNGRPFPLEIQIVGAADSLPFKDESLDWTYSSHLLEDFPRAAWRPFFREWMRCLKAGGFAVVLVPEKDLWAKAIERGQPPNCSHFAPEPVLGELSACAEETGFKIVEERLTNLNPNDYSILGVFQKP